MADDEAVKEDKMRLLLRAEMKKHNKNLAGVAKQSGVIDPLDTPSSWITASLCAWQE
jgi:hypothetical protein